jgi:hypothetical protein
MAAHSRLAGAFGLTDADARRRHANPWSVYTRIPISLLLTVAIWSRVADARQTLVPRPDGVVV